MAAVDIREAPSSMLNEMNGATRLFPIIGDPIEYVESPTRLTHLGSRGHNGICLPMQVDRMSQFRPKL